MDGGNHRWKSDQDHFSWIPSYSIPFALIGATSSNFRVNPNFVNIDEKG